MTKNISAGFDQRPERKFVEGILKNIRSQDGLTVFQTAVKTTMINAAHSLISDFPMADEERAEIIGYLTPNGEVNYNDKNMAAHYPEIITEIFAMPKFAGLQDLITFDPYHQNLSLNTTAPEALQSINDDSDRVGIEFYAPAY